MALVAAVTVVVSVLLSVRFLLRGWLYDFLVVEMTTAWYHCVLRSDRLKSGSTLLDVGVGTASALLENASLVRGRRLKVHGIDYDSAYIDRARKRIAKHRLEAQVTVEHASVYEFAPKRGTQFDAVYFSGSLMIMPDPVAALKRCSSFLKPGSLVFSTQTLETRKSTLAEFVKPVMSTVTGIDFGQVTYESDFYATIAEAGLTILETVPIQCHNPLKRNICLVIARTEK